MGHYQSVVDFGYGSDMKYFVNICAFSFIQLEEKCLHFSEWHIYKLNVPILSHGSIFMNIIYE